MADAHASPNYWMIWLYLFILTVIEIAVIYMPLARIIIVILLVTLACYKALLVALYFMHLRFERLTLGIIALTPFILCVFLILMLIPDLA
jgi:cytochrome c oxidase subunit IV